MALEMQFLNIDTLDYVCFYTDTGHYMIACAIQPTQHAGKVYATDYISCSAFCVYRFRVWTTKGQKKLQEFLAEMGCVCIYIVSSIHCDGYDMYNNLLKQQAISLHHW